MPKPSKTPKMRSHPRVRVVNLMDAAVEPSDVALRSLMSAVERTVVAKNTATSQELHAGLKTATWMAFSSFGIVPKH